MSKRRYYIQTFIIMCFLISFTFSFPVSVMGWNPLKAIKREAEDVVKKTENTVKKTTNLIMGEKEAAWYSDYQKAKKAAEKEDWTTTIKLFK